MEPEEKDEEGKSEVAKEGEAGEEDFAEELDGEGEAEADGEEEGKEDGEEGQEGPEGQEAEEGEAQAQDEQAEAAAIVTAPSKKRKLINQFNFCERAALTYTNPKRNVDTQTIPPPRSQFGANVLQWVIFDSYAQDYEQQLKEKERKDDKRVSTVSRIEPIQKPKNKTVQAEILNEKYLKCWQILERMINQNIFDVIANDYRFWEDPAD